MSYDWPAHSCPKPRLRASVSDLFGGYRGKYLEVTRKQPEKEKLRFAARSRSLLQLPFETESLRPGHT